ncbi:hypothetical protein GCK72_003346 [Caenorhabditis remanei]|uniref:Uncharacterized protein n=1 Tax=Caenorhabditis remanei TaxID=31234 RepID=A0A6A5HUR1_CAERE|nr:hypothetical protein GCK72_003346 [Caenorhabditis remanei]KAF1771519.1 hypothetical protein GCK72_003346 [Caenorhabditis remanei]
MNSEYIRCPRMRLSEPKGHYPFHGPLLPVKLMMTGLSKWPIRKCFRECRRPRRACGLNTRSSLRPSHMYFFSNGAQEWRNVSEHFAIKWRVGVPPEASCCVYFHGRPREVFPLEVLMVESPIANHRMTVPRRQW